MGAARIYDVIVWGATGFTGKWVAKHLFDHYSQRELGWAIAGRDVQKLDAVRDFIGDENHSVKSVLADSKDEVSLQQMVSKTKVLISTVGPYAQYGSLLVKACAEAGTHYVDLCGEVPWMREMIDSYQLVAEKSGARIVHSCGFDSIPSDMGTYFIQSQAKKQFGCYLQSVRFALIKAKGGVSGGTVHSLLNIMQQVAKNKKIRRIMLNPYSLNPDPTFSGPDKMDQRAAQYSEALNRWTAPFLMSAINTRIVRRSNALMQFRYAQDFRYSETMVTGKGVRGAALAASIACGFTALAAAALTRPGRKLLALMLPEQGKGPEIDPLNPGFYIIEFNGKTADGDKMTARLTADADPGYGSTAKMLAESALCLALHEGDLQVGGGFWTPASAMGQHLIDRLQHHAGLTFRVIDNQTDGR